MTRLRARFERGERVKYISHLDLLKFFERAIRRAGIPIAYSQGFNPHPQMVFGLPLSVGVRSSAEYADFEFDRTIEPDSFMEAINRQMPDDLKVLDCKELKSKDNIMKLISLAAYEVSAVMPDYTNIDEINKRLSEFLSNTEIIIKKEGKKGLRDVDIRPMVKSCDISMLPDGQLLFRLLLSAGSEANLKPEFFIGAFSEAYGLLLKVGDIDRTGLFVTKNGKILSPIDDEIVFI